MKRSVLLSFLIEEENEDEENIELLMNKKRKPISPLYSNRSLEGAFQVTVKQRLCQDETKFKEYFRLSKELFVMVLGAIKQDLLKKSCNRYKNPITPEEKLCITLRYLATGESFRSLSFQYRIKHSWISVIVRDVLKSIRKRLLSVHIPQPTEEVLTNNVREFLSLWNFPNCCAAIDGKHIRIVCPNNAGSLFYNYKQFHSVVLLALVDARYRFIAIDVGSYGREGDAAIFSKSNMGKEITNGNFNLPPPSVIPGTNVLQPNVILGDEAFSLTTTMMKPYPKIQSSNDRSKSIYNYRHSRARRTTENAFGIMCKYFRIFYTPIAVNPDAVDDLIVSSCILHNMLRNSKIPYPGENNANYEKVQLPTENLISLTASTNRRATSQAETVRANFKDYFTGPGSVPWQYSKI